MKTMKTYDELVWETNAITACIILVAVMGGLLAAFAPALLAWLRTIGN